MFACAYKRGVDGPNEIKNGGQIQIEDKLLHYGAVYIMGVTHLLSTYILSVADEHNPMTHAKLESQKAVKKMDNTRHRNEIKAYIHIYRKFIATKWQAETLCAWFLVRHSLTELVRAVV